MKDFLKIFLNFFPLFQYFKFISGNALILLFNLLATFSLTNYFDIWYVYSYGIVQILELILHYFYHSIITFKVYAKFIRFFLVIFFIAFTNWLVVYILSFLTDLNYILLIIIVSGLISVINFLINKYYVYIKQSRKS